MNHDNLREVILQEFRKPISRHIWGTVTRDFEQWTSVCTFPDVNGLSLADTRRHGLDIKTRLNVHAQALGVIEDMNIIRLMQQESRMFRHRMQEIETHYVSLIVRLHTNDILLVDIA